MTSIMTNSAAMSALKTLRNITNTMEDTQSHISSGYRVGSAADNAAYWSISTTMRSDNAALSTVGDALGLAAAKTDTAYTAMESAINVVTEIKSKLVAAREPGVDKEKINAEITELKSQLSSIAESASFSGENWLYNESTASLGTKEMVASFTRDSSGNVSVGVLEFNASTTTLIGTQTSAQGTLTADTQVQQRISTATTATTAATYFLIDPGATDATGTEVVLSSTTDDLDLEGMISAVDSMLESMTDAAASLGATNSRIDMQNEFISDLMDVIDKGVGRLVDADMNEESTKLKALQTQQQLGIQALSIANSDSQNVLSLFR